MTDRKLNASEFILHGNGSSLGDHTLHFWDQHSLHLQGRLPGNLESLSQLLMEGELLGRTIDFLYSRF